MHETAIITLSGIGFIGLFCQWLAWRVKLPAILFLLMAGIVAGPVLGTFNPDQTFGQLLLPIISLSVAVILFEGSLTLKFSEIQGLQTVVRRLVTTGVMITWVIIAFATHFLLEFSWKISVLFGAIIVVTGPTVVVPMLRTVRPTANVSNILRWEGIVIDPIGALLAVLVFQFIISEADSGALSHTLIFFGRSLALSTLIGGSIGYGFGLLIRHHWLPEFLHNYAALAMVFGVYAAANAVQHESGLLAVTAMGVCLANMKRVPTEDILNFKESLSVLLISGLFIILAARINFVRLADLGWHAVGVFLVIQFIARPIKALFATWGTSLTWGERLLIAWIAPRGIVAAATAAVFAVRLQEIGYQEAKAGTVTAQGVLLPMEYVQAELLVPLTFMVIIGTVVLQSITSRFLALRLGVAEPAAKGFLIAGANGFAREMAKALNECGYRVLVTATSLNDIRAARMDGLTTYYGNIVSEHADYHLDLVGIGALLALTEHQEINQLACRRYRGEFGRKSVFMVQTDSVEGVGAKSRFIMAPEGRTLFQDKITLQTLLQWLREGAKIHKTILTEQHNYQRYQEHYRNSAVPLFAVSPKGTIEFFGDDNDFSPKVGWTVMSLVQADPVAAKVVPD